jgi:hypothetical protein
MYSLLWPHVTIGAVSRAYEGMEGRKNKNNIVYSLKYLGSVVEGQFG